MRSAFEDFIGDFLSFIHGTVGLEEGHIVAVLDEHIKGFENKRVLIERAEIFINNEM